MRLRVIRFIAGIILTGATYGVSAQSFDAASVKPADPGAVGSTFQFPPGGRLTISNGTLRQIVETAWYDFRDFQIVGGPSWLNSERFDISAVSDSHGAADGIPEVRRKLQALLTERFELRVHTETRELPMYRLTPARGGPKIESTNSADNSAAAGIQNSCGRLIGTRTTMANLRVYLSRLLHRPVEDDSGRAGKYDFEVEWIPDDAPCSPLTDGPSLFTALQEKLGLRLESAKGPQEVLVIDSVKRPGEN
jgi:uncharacterized protein (TIGR03435 family)